MVRGLDGPFLLEEGEVIFPAGVSPLKAEEGNVFCEGRTARLRGHFSNEKGKRAGKDEDMQGARAARLRSNFVTSKIKPGPAFALSLKKRLKAKGGSGKGKRKERGKRGGRAQGLCGAFKVGKRNLKN